MDSTVLIGIIVTLALLAVAFFTYRANSTSNDDKPVEPVKKEAPKAKENKKKEEKKEVPHKKSTKEDTPLRVGAFKGHTGTVTSHAVSSDGKYAATSSEDRTIKIWEIKTLKESDIKSIHIPIPYDHATAICFTADSRHLLVVLKEAEQVVAFKILPKKDDKGKQYQEAHRFPLDKSHAGDVKQIAASTNSKFVVTMSDDTKFNVWTIKGALLHTVDTSSVKNNKFLITPDSRFIAVATWTSEVKLWEVLYDKEGNFKEVKKTMELFGHSSTIHSISVSADATKIATCSKDHSWKVYNINVKNNSPNIIFAHQGEKGYDHVGLSEDARTVATTQGNLLTFFRHNPGNNTVDSLDTVTLLNTPLGLEWNEDQLFVYFNQGITVFSNPNPGTKKKGKK